MDINNFIVERGEMISSHLYVIDQLTFVMVQALDKNHKHIPDWYKDKRVGKLIDFFINELIIKKSQVKYRFLLGYGFDPVPLDHDFKLVRFQLINFTIFDLSLAELSFISNVLPSEGIKSKIGFQVSEPYYLDEDKDKLLQKYNLYCKL